MSVCRYCNRTAKYFYPKSKVRLCGKCMALCRDRRWEDLASRWLRERPSEWVPDVAAFLELGSETLIGDDSAVRLDEYELREMPCKLRGHAYKGPHTHPRVVPVRLDGRLVDSEGRPIA
jgi:hypothetical protein